MILKEYVVPVGILPVRWFALVSVVALLHNIPELGEPDGLY